MRSFLSWLLNIDLKSAGADAELSLREADAAAAEKRRSLALLLDLEDERGIELAPPALPAPLPAERVAALREAWSSCRAVRQAVFCKIYNLFLSTAKLPNELRLRQ